MTPEPNIGEITVVESLGYQDEDALDQISGAMQNDDYTIITLFEDQQSFLVYWPEGE